MSVLVMRMGLVGFADEKQLRNLLMTRNRNLQWERWPFMEADALWINGEHARCDLRAPPRPGVALLPPHGDARQARGHRQRHGRAGLRARCNAARRGRGRVGSTP